MQGERRVGGDAEREDVGRDAGGERGSGRWRQSLDAAGAAAGAAGAGVLLEELPLSVLLELLELLVDPADFDADEPPRLSVL